MDQPALSIHNIRDSVILLGIARRGRLVAKGTVLIIDDERFIVDFLTEVLEAAGYLVYATADAQAARRLAGSVQPDVILLDILLPSMDGSELAYRLRADPQTTDIPIIVVSALPDIHTHAALMAVDDYLAKPFDLDDLLDRVRHWSQNRPRRDSLSHL